ncbi:MAG: site-2 protease family protein [Candidatus Omnitrophica bacterium]|nr:site-2 protease family protein [Candidatus Omnitrophota bacterium]
MGLISLLFSNPFLFIIIAVIILYSVILHEVAHGWVAHLFGDNTALYSGRLTLNPKSHLDPIGTVALFIVGFGWARPVPVNYASFSNRRWGLFSVALAGCATNILIAVIAIFLLQFNFINNNPVWEITLTTVARINIILGAFNLIPIPPLDGSKVLMSFLSYRAQESLTMLEPYGFFILALLLFTGLLNPVIIFMQGLITYLIGLLFGLFRFR